MDSLHTHARMTEMVLPCTRRSLRRLRRGRARKRLRGGGTRKRRGGVDYDEMLRKHLVERCKYILSPGKKASMDTGAREFVDLLVYVWQNTQGSREDDVDNFYDAEEGYEMDKEAEKERKRKRKRTRKGRGRGSGRGKEEEEEAEERKEEEEEAEDEDEEEEERKRKRKAAEDDTDTEPPNPYVPPSFSKRMGRRPADEPSNHQQLHGLDHTHPPFLPTQLVIQGRTTTTAKSQILGGGGASPTQASYTNLLNSSISSPIPPTCTTVCRTTNTNRA